MRGLNYSGADDAYAEFLRLGGRHLGDDDRKVER